MSTTAHLEQIGRAYGFTLDELRANQRSELHPAQRARGLRKGLMSIVVLTLLGSLALAGGLLGGQAFRDSLGDEPSQVNLNGVTMIRGSGVLVALAFFAGAGMGMARRRKRRAAFALGRIDVLEGAMTKIHVRGHGIPDRYIFRVGNRSFDVKSKLWELLTQGAAYRLYFVADQLLSFAPVLDDPATRDEYDREMAHAERTGDIRPSKLVQ